MPGQMITTGIDEQYLKFTKLGQEIEGIAKEALFKGAGVMADTVTAEIATIKTEKFHMAINGDKRLASPQEKAALQRTVGIAKFKGNGGEVDTLVGITGSGYANVAGKRTPVIVIARSINGGTDFMIKQPVFRRAANKGRPAAQAAIIETAENRIEETTK